MRVRFGPIALPPGLKRGRCRELDDGGVTALLTAVGRGASGRDQAERMDPARQRR